jgi:hypothetical protein
MRAAGKAAAHLRVGDGAGEDRAGDVEDAVAAGDGRHHAAVVQQVGLEQPQPLPGAVKRCQVRVLGVACARHRSSGHAHPVDRRRAETEKKTISTRRLIESERSQRNYRDHGRCRGPCSGHRRGGAPRARRR